MTDPHSAGSTSPTSKAKAWSAWYGWLGMALAPAALCLLEQGGYPGGAEHAGHSLGSAVHVGPVMPGSYPGSDQEETKSVSLRY